MNPASPRPSNPIRARLWSHRHRNLIFCVITIVLISFGAIGLNRFQNHLVRSEVKAKLAAIRAQGLPTDLASLNSFYVPVPDAENAALLLDKVSRQIVNWPYYDPQIGISSTSLRYATNPITPAGQAALGSIISSNQTALKLIYAAATRSQFRYPWDLTTTTDLPINHWGELKKLVQLLRLESLHHLAENRKLQALSAVEASLFVTRSLDGEPFIASLLVQYACADITLDGLEQLLQRTDFPADDLQRLQASILALENRIDVSRVLQGSRAYALGTWHEPALVAATHSGYAIATPFDTFPAFFQKSAWQMYEQGGHKEADLLNYLDLFEEILATAKLPPADALVVSKKLENRLHSSLKPSMNMIKTTAEVMPLFRVFPKHAGFLATLRNAQTALAVERFRLENHRLPESLRDVIPRYLSKAPLDPFTGHPLQYRITDHGFRVYCLGDNGQDDGGRTRVDKSSPGADDMVFAVERPTP